MIDRKGDVNEPSWGGFLIMSNTERHMDALFNSIVPRQLRDQMFLKYFRGCDSIFCEYEDGRHVFFSGDKSDKILFNITRNNETIRVHYWKKYKKRADPDEVTIFYFNKETNTYDKLA